MRVPLDPVANGRDRTGRFAPGNKHGRGNAQARRVHRLRAALLREVKPEDVADIARMLIEKARSGITSLDELSRVRATIEELGVKQKPMLERAA